MNELSLQNIIHEYGIDHFKTLVYHYGSSYDYCCILDSCQLSSGMQSDKYELLAAFGAEQSFTIYNEDFDELVKDNWVFGILAYDLKNRFEKLESLNPEYIKTPELSLFVPQTVLSLSKNGEIKIEKGIINQNFNSPSAFDDVSLEGLVKTNQIDQTQYLNKVRGIKDLIRQGEVYELNYCVQHQYKFSNFNPLEFQLKLLKKSPTPMASFFRWQNVYLCGASMERFLSRRDSKILSQPIKGTIRKGKDHIEDQQLISALYQSEKDRAENVMIVDLVRNDLAKICKAGSIKVEELFGIYSYLQLHQMISSISGELQTDSLNKILQASFPMGSMTGAPKIAAMKIIDELEDFKRSWYSGSIGYIEPNGDFDFNVIIRSLICDMSENKIAYSAGGAITIDSIPEQEWLECLLKTKAIESILID